MHWQVAVVLPFCACVCFGPTACSLCLSQDPLSWLLTCVEDFVTFAFQKEFNFKNYFTTLSNFCEQEHCDGLAFHPQVQAVMSLVASCWVPCDRLASHPWVRAVMSLVTSCWVPCDGLASHPGVQAVMSLIASCWVPCDGLAFHPGVQAVMSLIAS